MAKTWKPCNNEFIPQAFWEARLAPAEAAQGTGVTRHPHPPPGAPVLAFGQYEALLLGFHIYGFDCKIPQPPSLRDDY